jgi:Family of unknown function (DUF5684)
MSSPLSSLADITYTYKTTGGISAAFILVMLLIAIIFYVLTAWLLYRIGKRLGYDKSWYAWVPFLNLYMMVELSTKETSWFWIILVLEFIPCINIIGLVMLVIVFMDIAERCGKERWWGILWIIPIVNWVVMYILGSGEAPPPPPQQGYYPPAGTPPYQGPPPGGSGSTPQRPPNWS